MTSNTAPPFVELGIAPLNDADIAMLDERRTWVASYPGFFGNLNQPTGKLQLIDMLLRNESSYNLNALQSLGVVLGDALVLSRNMQWYMLDTDIGRLPCVGVPETVIKVFPVPYFSDLHARGERTTAHAAYTFFCKAIDDALIRLNA